MSWWMWLGIGFVLLACEMLTPGGFYLVFVGMAAMIVGGATALGLTHEIWNQVFTFAALSAGLVALARRPLIERLRLTSADRASVDDVVGENATPKETIAPGQIGAVELRGTVWRARNASATDIIIGQRCRVSSIDGLTLVVSPEGTNYGGKS